MSQFKSQPMQTHHAVLIGVGISVSRVPTGNEKRPQDKSLRGAKVDIDAIEDYLKAESHVKITRLTATRSAEGDIPIEHPSKLSTLENVYRVLGDIVSNDAEEWIKNVYIHFSGHGTRSPQDGTLSLAMYHPGAQGVNYLYGKVLAQYLTKMISCGKSVTLVLDCCFSASIQRADENSPKTVRFLEYDPEIDQQSASANILGPDVLDSTRNSELHTKGLLDPQAYTVLTACGSDEETTEIKSSDGTERGALSYYLVRSLHHLRKANTQISFETLFRQLQTTFHAEHPYQTPIRYGNADVFFFKGLWSGSGGLLIPAFLHPTSGRLVLHAGEIHGVNVGDEYWAYPYYASEETEKSMPQSQRVRLRIETVHAFESHFALVDGSMEQRFTRAKTWKAIPITTFSPNRCRIRLLESVPEIDHKQLTKGLCEHPFVELCTTAEPSTVNIGFGADGKYQVDHCKTKGFRQTSKILGSKGNQIPYLIDVVGHLATFRFFERIQHRNQEDFEKSFSLEATGEIGSDGRYQIQDGQMWELKITNKSQTRLYFTIFNLRPNWEIQNLIHAAGDGDYYSIDAGSDDTLSLEMQVPDFLAETGESESEDIMKVFITTHPVSFPGVALRPLGDGGMRNDVCQISRFLDDMVCYSVRDDTNASWATQNYLIRTICR